MFQHIPRRPLTLLTLCLTASILTSCGTQDAETPAQLPEVEGSVAGVQTIVGLSGEAAEPRPSAPLGLYTTLFIAQPNTTHAKSALAGLQAQYALNPGELSGDQAETYALLQQFGSVLQVDVVDILNRSQDRATTLNEYVTSLQNITARAKRKREELQATLARVKTDLRAARTKVSTLERDITKAQREHDYETAGAMQQDLSTAQAAQAKLEGEERQFSDLEGTFDDLIAVADERLLAIENNRAVLIAGLVVVDVPGIDALGLIKKKPRERASGGEGGGYFGEL